MIKKSMATKLRIERKKKARKDEKEREENMQKKKQHERKNTIPSEFDYRKKK